MRDGRCTMNDAHIMHPRSHNPFRTVQCGVVRCGALLINHTDNGASGLPTWAFTYVAFYHMDGSRLVSMEEKVLEMSQRFKLSTTQAIRSFNDCRAQNLKKKSFTLILTQLYSCKTFQKLSIYFNL